MLRPGVLRVTEAVPWSEIAGRLRPFVARRVAPADVDDVIQDVAVRMQRGLGGLRDDDRYAAWMFQVARSAIGEHLRQRARHPLPATDEAEPVADDDAGDDDRADRLVADGLVACVAAFVALLPSPYREAVTLVELEGLTAREAAELAGISVSGMKSRVQRGRAMLRDQFDQCCAIALDARGKPIEAVPRCGC